MDKQPSRWTTYYESTSERPPHESLVEAIAYVSSREAAIDVGAGAMRDTRHLLHEAFESVVALDAEPINQNGEITDDRLTVITQAFETYDFPENNFDLVNAQFSLPFTAPESFEAVFKGILASLKPEGVFVGQLFGTNDEWSKNPRMTFHTHEDIKRLIQEMKVLKLEGREYDGKTATGTPKHWHFFTIIARKPA
jgi:tellurite methyltransferase